MESTVDIGALSEISKRTEENIGQILLTNEHISEINHAIDALNSSINENPNVNRYDVTHLKGYLAEEWHARTFNINAITNFSENRAYTLNSNEKNSVDVETNFGNNYSLKYRNTAGRSVSEQSRYSSETGYSDYHGMERLIPSNQLEEAREIAERRTLSNLQTRPELSAAYAETAKHLTDRISDSEGSESIPLSLETSEKIAEESKTGNFNAENFGINRPTEIQINFVCDVLRAGSTAAGVRLMLRAVPELYKAIDYLIKNGEMDLSAVKKSGKKILTAGGEGYLQGAAAYIFSYALQQLCGAEAQAINPSLIGAMTAIFVSVIKSAFLLYRKKISFSDAKNMWVNTILSSVSFLAANMLVSKLNWQIPGFSFLSGSLLASSLMAVYFWGKDKFISVVERAGFVLFGPVGEGYKIPEEFQYIFDFDQSSWKDKETNVLPDMIRESEFETIRFTMDYPGLIRVNLVGCS